MSRRYTPRRQSKRWLDGDCPQGVLCILDNRGKTADRYTVIYREPVAGTTYADMVLWGRGMSSAPSHPQGVGMYFETSAADLAGFRYREKPGKWSDLPEAVKRCIRADLTEEGHD